MSPLSPFVLAGATVVAAPALWAGLVDQTMPLDVALTRYLIAVAICWGLITLVADLAFPRPGSVKPVKANPEDPAEPQSTDTASAA